MNLCIFPNEVLVRIFYYCDIDTLENIRKIDESWNRLVWSMFTTKSFWSKTCKTYMNEYDLFEYRKEFLTDNEPKTNEETEKIWMHMYRNWMSWSNVANLDFSHRTLQTNDVCGEIYCAKIVDDLILVGTNIGLVYQYHVVSGVFLSRVEHANAPIFDISAMDKKTSANLKFKSPYVYLKLNNEIRMYQIDDERSSNGEFPIIKLREAEYFCTQEDRFAYIDIFRNLRVGLIQNQNNRFALNTLWAMSVGDKTLLGMSIWKNFVTVSFTHKTVVYKFKDFHAVGNDPDVLRSSRMLLLMHTLRYEKLSMAIGNFSFYNGIFVSISYGRILFVNVAENALRKRFKFDFEYNVPTYVVLHGRLLIIGCECGKIYFYCIKNWQNFNLRDYDRMECLTGPSCDESIAHLSVSEIRGLHRIVVTTTKSIRFFEIDVPK